METGSYENFNDTGKLPDLKTPCLVQHPAQAALCLH